MGRSFPGVHVEIWWRSRKLAAHGSDPSRDAGWARRVSRIAVHPARQREGIGQQLIACACEQAAQCDYLSVSFGYTPELWRFWQRAAGFVLVRMGNHRVSEQRLLYGDGVIAAERRGKTAGAAGTDVCAAMRYPDAVERRGDTAGGVR